MRQIPARLSAVVPDAISTAVYLIAWAAPTLLGQGVLRGLLAAIVVEFLVMHASALYGFGLAGRDDRYAKRAWILTAISVVYLVPITLMAVQLDSPGIILSFLWLFPSRFAFMLTHPASVEVETSRMKSLWLVSLLTYFVGVIALTKLPLPALGLTPEFVASMSMSGHPNPNAQPPQISIAFGALYFLVQACAKYYFAAAGRTERT